MNKFLINHNNNGNNNANCIKLCKYFKRIKYIICRYYMVYTYLPISTDDDILCRSTDCKF